MKLSRRQKAAIPFLLTTGGIPEAAAASGVAETTLRAWLRDPDFASLIDSLLDEGIKEATQRIATELGKLGPIAVEKLGDMLRKEKLDDETRLRAINSVIDRLTKIAALRSGRAENV
ncbi:MAG: hypothetical protein WAL45_16135 [Terracidiphilus sp.]